MTNNSNQPDESVEVLPPTLEGGVERELFGKWTIILKNVGGLFAVLVVCVMGLANCYSTYVSVIENKAWPSEMSVFIMVVGPVVCSWTWMNSSKTISTILGATGDFTKIREKVAKAIAPTPKE